MFSAWSGNRLIVNLMRSNEGILNTAFYYPTKRLPSATLARCCPPTRSRWPRARWGSTRSPRSWLCVRRGWTDEKCKETICCWKSWVEGRRWRRRRDSAWRTRFVETDQQLGRTVLGVLRRLLLADLAEVPHVEPPVGAAGGQDGLIVGRPLDLLGRVAMRVQPDSQTVVSALFNVCCSKTLQKKQLLEINKGILDFPMYQCFFVLTVWRKWGWEFGIKKTKVLYIFFF